MGLHGWEAVKAVPECREFWVIPAAPEGLALLPECRSWQELYESQSDVFECVARPADASSSITFTSGTTGVAKGAEHTHGNEFLMTAIARHEYGMQPGETILSPVPLFSSYRFSVVLTTCLTGSTLVILPRFEPVATWRALEEHKANVLYAVSTMLHRMHDAMEASGVDLDKIAPHWRLCISGSTALLPDVHRFFMDRLGVDISIPYGATEVLLAMTLKEPVPGDPCAIGRPIANVLVRIVDESMNEVPVDEVGEIVIRSATRMKRYCNSVEATRESFSGDWFHTGDLGRRDANGGFHLAGRIKDMINRNGFKVFPVQLENVLLAHPAIAHAAVVGIPDERVGEEVKAYIVLKEGAQCTAEELTAWTRERVAAFAYPRHIEFCKSLPLARYGTVVKRLLPHAEERDRSNV
jgi:long-chain acyl-CoA synthetase